MTSVTVVPVTDKRSLIRTFLTTLCGKIACSRRLLGVKRIDLKQNSEQTCSKTPPRYIRVDTVKKTLHNICYWSFGLYSRYKNVFIRRWFIRPNQEVPGKVMTTQPTSQTQLTQTGGYSPWRAAAMHCTDRVLPVRDSPVKDQSDLVAPGAWEDPSAVAGRNRVFLKKTQQQKVVVLGEKTQQQKIGASRWKI